MSKRIYVGNLSFGTTEEGLRNHFGQFGDVQSVSIVTDRDTGRSRGFGFIEMEAGDADNAISNLNEVDLDGRSLKVNEARPREDRRPQRRERW